jgi:hypothetical protein
MSIGAMNVVGVMNVGVMKKESQSDDFITVE